MDCAEFRKLTSLYFEGALDDNQLDAFADHVVVCTTCEKHLLSEANRENTTSQQASE